MASQTVVGAGVELFTVKFLLIKREKRIKEKIRKGRRKEENREICSKRKISKLEMEEGKKHKNEQRTVSLFFFSFIFYMLVFETTDEGSIQVEISTGKKENIVCQDNIVENDIVPHPEKYSSYAPVTNQSKMK